MIFKYNANSVLKTQERWPETRPAPHGKGLTERDSAGTQFRAFIVLALLSLSACSVTDYRQPIGNLAGAVDQSVASIDQLDQRMTALQNEKWRVALVGNAGTTEAIIVTAEDTCTSAGERCRLEILVGNEPARPFPATSVIPKAKAGLAGLSAYVANLRAIVDADTVNQVTASANAALGSLKRVETEIAEAGGPEGGPVERFGQPTVAGITWIVGQYVAYAKTAALKKATGRAQPVVDKLAEFYDGIARAAADVELGAATEEFVAAQEAYDSAAAIDSRMIDQYVAAAEEYDQKLRATAARPLKAFADAHAKLTDQLHGKASLPEAMAAIELLAAKAKEFQKIVDDFEKALNRE